MMEFNSTRKHQELKTFGKRCWMAPRIFQVQNHYHSLEGMKLVRLFTCQYFFYYFHNLSFCKNSDTPVTLPASLILEEVDSQKYHTYTPIPHAYPPACSSPVFYQDGLGISLDNNISLTIAQKQKFTIHEISPEWCYTSEGTKVCIMKIRLSSSYCSCFSMCARVCVAVTCVLLSM